LSIFVIISLAFLKKYLLEKRNQPRILAVIAGNYIYGKEVVGLQVLEALNAQSDLLTIISGWNDGTFKKELENRNIAYKIIKLGWIYITKPLWTLDSLIHIPGAWLSYMKIIGEFKPDIIYTDSYRNVILLWPFLRKKSVVLHVHEEHAYVKRGKGFIQKVLPKTNRFIAVSEFIKKDLLACGVPEKTIRVVYNSTKEIDGVKKVYMPGDVLRIGIIGQVLKTKGHEDLIDALILLKGKMAFTLSITGTGDEDYIEILKNKISANGLGELVNWNGYVEDKGQVYENLDVVVAPSRKNESFGLVAAESGMYYCATIVTDAGALSEIVKDGETGFVVAKEDPAGIADRIHKLYDRQTLTEMGQNGRQRVQKLFSEKAFKSEILSALELSIKN